MLGGRRRDSSSHNSHLRERSSPRAASSSPCLLQTSLEPCSKPFAYAYLQTTNLMYSMGHALGNSLQDLLIRYNRQRGKTTLWLPGCDHAGIATQNIVEETLWKLRKQTRRDLGRDKFIDLVQDWKEHHQKINNALRKMGSSLDWSREAFCNSAYMCLVQRLCHGYQMTLILTGAPNRMRTFRQLSPRFSSHSTKRESSTEPIAWLTGIPP